MALISFRQYRPSRGESGMAMVETVIVLPVLLMLLFAIVEFAIAFGRWQVLSNAAREGARAAVVYRDPAACTAAGVRAEVEATVAGYASAFGMAIDPAQITITGACTPGPLTVSASFDHDYVVLPNFADSIGPTLTLLGTSTMRNEG